MVALWVGVVFAGESFLTETDDIASLLSASAAGDVFVLPASITPLSLELNHSLTLIGTGVRGETALVVAADSPAFVVKVTDGELALYGLTLEGGAGALALNIRPIGSPPSATTPSVVGEHVHFFGGQKDSWKGGNVHAEGDFSCTSCVFEQGGPMEVGGAIYSKGASISLGDSVFFQPQAGLGSALFLEEDSSLVTNNVVFCDTQGESLVSLVSSTWDSTFDFFWNNDSGGHLVESTGGEALNFTNSFVVQNEVQGNLFSADQVNAINVVFLNNNATYLLEGTGTNINNWDFGNTGTFSSPFFLPSNLSDPTNGQVFNSCGTQVVFENSSGLEAALNPYADADLDGVLNLDDCGDVQTLVYPDKDGDGFGDHQFPVVFCGTGLEFQERLGLTTVWVDEGPEDCDDQSSTVNPEAPERPGNMLDDDCDPLTLDGDMDQDGFLPADDCDDMDPAVFPGAVEVAYNGKDDDCDPSTLDDDLDEDGFDYLNDCDDHNGDVSPNSTEEPYNGLDDDCDPATLDDDLDEDEYLLSEDCDDANPLVSPAQMEVPFNNLDDDCDPLTLDDDFDQDGFSVDEDCDDHNFEVNPGVAEVPFNNLDDDCDPTTLDSEPIPDDLDGDGFSPPEDCDDNNGDVNPRMVEEAYNGLDDDCDPNTLDDDLDGDGFVIAEDCDDNEKEVNPGKEELPNNGFDDDCDPSTPDDDKDGDGVSAEDDCDDNDPNILENCSVIPVGCQCHSVAGAANFALLTLFLPFYARRRRERFHGTAS